MAAATGTVEKRKNGHYVLRWKQCRHYPIITASKSSLDPVGVVTAALFDCWSTGRNSYSLMEVCTGTFDSGSMRDSCLTLSTREFSTQI